MSFPAAQKPETEGTEGKSEGKAKPGLTGPELREIADFIEHFDRRLTQDRLPHLKAFLEKHPTYLQWPHWPYKLMLSQVFPSEIPSMVQLFAHYNPDVYTTLPPVILSECNRQYYSIHNLRDKPSGTTTIGKEISKKEQKPILMHNPSHVDESIPASSSSSGGCVVCKEVGRLTIYVPNVVNMGCGHVVCCLHCAGWYDQTKACWKCQRPVTEWLILADTVPAK